MTSPTRRRTGKILFLASLAVLPASSPALGADSNEWAQLLDKNAKTLRSHDFKHAEKTARKLTDRIVAAHRNGGGDLLARVTFQRALALYGLGEKDEAAWYLNLAEALDVGLVHTRVQVFGSIAQSLDQEAHARRTCMLNDPIPKEEIGQNDSPPTPRRASNLRAPLAWSTEPGVITLDIQVCVTEEGSVQAPTILRDNGHPAAAFLALEDQRAQRFKPATHQGRPERTLFGSHVNFPVWQRRPEAR